jgi:hypothetical protein
MAEAPLFPQADPAMCYVVGQVAKIDDTQACTAGYYTALNNVARRLEKTDDELNKVRGLIEGLNPDDAARYFREGMNRAIKEVQTEATRDVKSTVDRQVSRLEGSASRLEDTVFTADQRIKTLYREIGEVDKTLVSAANHATAEFAEAVENGEKVLLDTSSYITTAFLQIETKQLEMQDEFEKMVRQNTMALPIVYRILIGGLLFALGMAVGKFVMI